MSGPTREEVIRWAEESGVCYESGGLLFAAIREDCDMAEEVAKLVALAYASGQAAEREACAKLASDLYAQARADEIAEAISARGKA